MAGLNSFYVLTSRSMEANLFEGQAKKRNFILLLYLKFCKCMAKIINCAFFNKKMLNNALYHDKFFFIF